MLFFQVEYDTSTGEFSKQSNIKPERQREILTEWVRYYCQRSGWRAGPAIDGKHTIRIELDLADDRFATSTSAKLASDPVIVGIVQDVLSRMDERAEASS